MIKFVKIKINRKEKIYRNIGFLEDIYHLYKKFDRFINDDYSKENLLDEIIMTVERCNPFFWVILDGDKFAG
ncbi:hypothetical protein IJ707_07290, partial [bacterium]|nr:hypothetical protein [bacterium]